MRVTVSHFEIPARDPARAAAFYRAAFGWRVEPHAWRPDGAADAEYFTVRTAAPEAPAAHAVVGAIQGGLGTPERIGAPRPLLVLHVEEASLDACLRRVVAAGGTVDLPPEAIGTTGSFARCRDPEGNLLGLWRQAPREV